MIDWERIEAEAGYSPECKYPCRPLELERKAEERGHHPHSRRSQCGGRPATTSGTIPTTGASHAAANAYGVESSGPRSAAAGTDPDASPNPSNVAAAVANAPRSTANVADPADVADPANLEPAAAAASSARATGPTIVAPGRACEGRV